MKLKDLFLPFIIVCFMANNASFANASNDTTGYLPAAVTPNDRSNGSIVSIQATSGDKDNPGVKIYRLCYMSDGLEIIGFLVMPSNATKKLPVLIYNHGGCDNWSKITGHTLDYLSYLSLTGKYIVLASQYRGVDGSQGNDGWCGSDLNDVLNLLPVVGHIPMADSSKIVMLGESRGGAETYGAIKAGAPLKAAVVVSGNTDLIQAYEDRGDGMKSVLRNHLGGTPITAPDAYKSRSAFYWPDKINVPTLILHGDADDRVRVTEAQKLAAKLDELNKPHKLVIVPNGNHCFRNNGQPNDQMIVAILEWFAKYTTGP